MNKQDRLKIIDNIKYELAKGTHTYAMCKCGRNSARGGGKCWECLLEKLK